MVKGRVWITPRCLVVKKMKLNLPLFSGECLHAVYFLCTDVEESESTEEAVSVK